MLSDKEFVVVPTVDTGTKNQILSSISSVTVPFLFVKNSFTGGRDQN